MRLLLDTCTFLWLVTEDKTLSQKARDLFVDPSNEVYLSAVSSWEIAVKYALGKLPLPRAPAQLVPEERERHRIAELPLEERAALAVARLPEHHRDPFDRMLVAQAVMASMTLLTPDPLITQYPVPTVW
jgi:PIN domain nuclease of toxin-antitoxin system